jgi:hypothetical protein
MLLVGGHVLTGTVSKVHRFYFDLEEEAAGRPTRIPVSQISAIRGVDPELDAKRRAEADAAGVRPRSLS